mgnify:CR=1 FL=1
MKKDRRQFLKNTAMAGLVMGLSPILAKTSIGKKADELELQDSCNQLTQDIYGEGPFYTANAQVSDTGVIASIDEPGTRIRITGIVKNIDCTKVIPNTILDLWQANDAGEYDNSGYNLRRKVKSNSAGFYSFETVLPGKYLFGETYRPRHIHLKVTTPGSPTFTTQIYFEGDTSIPEDIAASRNFGEFDATNRIISLTENDGVLEGTWDIVVDGNGVIGDSVLGVNDLHLTNGMIYAVSPNPFVDELKINYGVFKPSRVKIEIFGMQGELVASVDEKELDSEKYTAIWRPQAHIAAGTYFCVLKMNDLQVHYQKIIKL